MSGAFDYKATAVAALAGTKTRWRKPFSIAERGKSGVRIATNGLQAFTPSLIDNANTFVNVIPFDAATNGSIFVVVGPGGNGSAYTVTTTLYTSADLRTWTARTVSSEQRSAVCWSGAKFIAGCISSTACFTSSDGITWGSGGAFATQLGATPLLTRFGGKVFAFPFGVASTAYYESSNDGTSWTSRTLPNSLNFSNINRSQIAVTDDAIYLAFNNAAVATVSKTTDGTNWTTVRSEAGPNTTSSLTYFNIAAYGSLVVISNVANGACVRSTDGGATWSTPYSITYSSPSYTMSSVTTAFAGAGSIGPRTGFDSMAGMSSTSVNGRVGFLVSVTQFAYNGTANSVTSAALLHSADGLAWSLEPIASVVVIGAMKPVDFSGKTYFLLTGLQYSPTAATLQTTNPDFSELVYDV